MALQSLVAEITGAIPISDAATDIAPGRRVLIVFENGRTTLKDWHNDLLWIDRDRLRLLNVSVVSIPSEGDGVLLNGIHATLPTDRLKVEVLGNPEDEKPGVVLISSDGRVLLRSDHAVTIQQIGDAIKTLDRENGWA
ncbi:hypothetical protein KX729_28955 [Rhizobium sp. XQZ8]|uniref:hypothetical protein n=1 Tax=Rhizobium populisoli TaxID=2859785 RepID=UPI001CA4EBC6|nr:hypothetical protein [Rhizobium populisoli]MBW6425449.1 hypothetical protein [Rhizobium populisoli]